MKIMRDEQGGLFPRCCIESNILKSIAPNSIIQPDAETKVYL